MTIYRKATDYNPFELITNEQIAKIIAVYDTKFTKSPADKECRLTDIGTSPLAWYITDICKKWIIWQRARNFQPTQPTLKSEFIEMLVRMVDKNYASQTGVSLQDAALELELITVSDLATFNKPLTRYEVAIILSDMHFKSKFINQLQSSTNTYNIISPVQSDDSTTKPWQQKIFIDLNSIDSKEFNNGYINIFNKSYKINKKETIYYFPTSYTRFGEISDITSDRVIGTISLAIIQQWWTKTMIQWFISLPNTEEIYTIIPTDQIPYYLIIRIK